MSKWKGILIWAGIVVLVGGVYLWFFWSSKPLAR